MSLVRRRVSAVIAAFALVAGVAGCGGNGSDVGSALGGPGVPGAPGGEVIPVSALVETGEGELDADLYAVDPETGEPFELSDEELDADDLWYLTDLWEIEASVDGSVEVGERMIGQPGFYLNHSYKLWMAGLAGAGGEPDDFTYQLEATITSDTTELATRLAVEEIGADAAGFADLWGSLFALQLRGAAKGGGLFGFDWLDNALGARVGPNWDSPIHDESGRVVRPPQGSLLIYQRVDIPFEADASAVVGSIGAGGWPEFGIVDMNGEETGVVDIYVVVPPIDGSVTQARITTYLNIFPTTPEFSTWFTGSGLLVNHASPDAGY